jgi:hypothetical protein
MSREERRQAWRVYAAAAASTLRRPEVTQGDIQGIEDVADRLLKAEFQRFDGPDHSGDANKMVERPWVGLTDAERSGIAELYLSAPSACGLYELLLRVEAQLKVKNGGTR